MDDFEIRNGNRSVCLNAVGRNSFCGNPHRDRNSLVMPRIVGGRLNQDDLNVTNIATAFADCIDLPRFFPAARYVVARPLNPPFRGILLAM
jgi:hypothetical protein